MTTYEKILLIVQLSGWAVAALVFALSWVAPRTKTDADDKALERLRWLQTNAVLAFSKIKYWTDSGKLPASVDRYSSYLAELDKAFEASWGAKLPESLLPQAKLLADGLHAAAKLQDQAPAAPAAPQPGNPTQSPASR